MGQKKIRKFQKLSDVFPECSQAKAWRQLLQLRQLADECLDVAEDLTNIIQQLNSSPSGDRHVSPSLDQNEQYLKHMFYSSSDLIFHRFELPAVQGKFKTLVVFIEGLVSRDRLQRDVTGALLQLSQRAGKTSLTVPPDYGELNNLIAASNINEVRLMSEIVRQLLNGSVALFVEGLAAAFDIEVKGWDKRAVTEPDIEAVIRGPREGFIEDLRTNTALLRKKIRNNNLVFENFIIGRQTNTTVAVGYLKGIVNEEVLKEVKKRLQSIDTEAILETGYIEQFIEDAPLSPLSTIGNTQKPDVVAAKLLEGRVAILCDGTPHVLTVPHLFIEGLQVSEDYYNRPFIASFLRVVRIMAYNVSVFLPGLYVALQTFHQEMIPTILLLRMTAAHEGIPFPALGETLIMTFFYELLRESGTRLPRAVGSAISIVGALIIGEGAVNAGLVSSSMVIVIAITGVTSFIVPALTEVMTLYRFLFIILGGVMGLYGIACGMFVTIVQAMSLRSFGVPYTTPLSPAGGGLIKDFLLRLPLWLLKLRPQAIAKRNRTRQNNTRRNS